MNYLLFNELFIINYWIIIIIRTLLSVLRTVGPSVQLCTAHSMQSISHRQNQRLRLPPSREKTRPPEDVKKQSELCD